MSEHFSLSLEKYHFDIEVSPDQVVWQSDRNIRVGKKEMKALQKGEVSLFNLLISSRYENKSYQHFFTHIILPQATQARHDELNRVLELAILPQLIQMLKSIDEGNLSPWIPEKYTKE